MLKIRLKVEEGRYFSVQLVDLGPLLAELRPIDGGSGGRRGLPLERGERISPGLITENQTKNFLLGAQLFAPFRTIETALAGAQITAGRLGRRAPRRYQLENLVLF